ncbi:unnamed protein product [Notodromas monacha]|uniref:Uncharacterized protein n=1 Tax=Notodromas monacha TaxID=399045 RepID=A0A7R9BJ96_9CRUS|nr:unnamed protein product [Notodromas monacha]CAG0916522.1 unnamed protein product [Notodromas monacha]
MRASAWSCVFLVAVVGNLALPPVLGAMKVVKPSADMDDNNGGKQLNYDVDQDASSSSSNNAFSPGKMSGSKHGSHHGHHNSSPQKKEDSPFSWKNIITMALQFVYKLLNPPSSSGLDKSGDGPILQDGEFSWTRLLSLAVKIALAGLGADTTGLDRADHGGPASPMECPRGDLDSGDPVSLISAHRYSMLTAALSILMSSSDPKEVTVMAKQAGELINLGMTLLDALKTSFSKRSLEARSLGSSDKYSEGAVAALSLIKGYAQSYSIEDDTCRQKAFCLANRACTMDAPGVGSMWCKVGTYMLTFGIVPMSNVEAFTQLTDAGRNGRLAEDCETIYPCNDVY